MLLVKLKCLDGKEKLRLLNTIGVSYTVSDKTVNVLKSYFKLFTILGEWKRVLLKKGCDYINKWKQKLFSLYHQEKRRCYKLITRVHYQVFYSSWVDETIISDILLKGNGWIVDKEVRSLWLTGTFLILFLHFYSSQQF